MLAQVQRENCVCASKTAFQERTGRLEERVSLPFYVFVRVITQA